MSQTVLSKYVDLFIDTEFECQINVKVSHLWEMYIYYYNNKFKPAPPDQGEPINRFYKFIHFAKFIKKRFHVTQEDTVKTVCANIFRLSPQVVFEWFDADFDNSKFQINIDALVKSKRITLLDKIAVMEYCKYLHKKDDKAFYDTLHKLQFQLHKEMINEEKDYSPIKFHLILSVRVK